MIIDNIIVIVVAVILITYLSINYIKKYAPLNLFFIAICAFCLGVYLPIIYYDVYLRIRYQIPLGIGIFVLPGIYAILQYNNIRLGDNLLYKSAINYYNSQKYTKCVTTLQKLIEKEGRKPEALFLISKCFYEEKEYEKAKEFIYEVVEKDTQNSEAYFILGSILEKEEDIDSAIDMYKKCLEIDNTNYDAYEALGILYANKGNYDDAEKIYKQAVEYHAEAYELLYNLSMIQLEKGKTSEAEKNLEFALVIKPDIDEAIYSLGNIKLLKGEYNEALTLYSEITKSENYGLKAYYKIAIIYVTKNEFDKAMGVIEYLVSEDNSYIDKIKNEFVFNSMRSRIDKFLTEKSAQETNMIIKEQNEIENIKKSRKSWFGKVREENTTQSGNSSSILYDDIDMNKIGFREEDNKNAF